MRRVRLFSPHRAGLVLEGEGEGGSASSVTALFSTTDTDSAGGDNTSISKECVQVLSASGTLTLAHPLEHCWSSLELLQPSEPGSGGPSDGKNPGSQGDDSISLSASWCSSWCR